MTFNQTVYQNYLGVVFFSYFIGITSCIACPGVGHWCSGATRKSHCPAQLCWKGNWNHTQACSVSSRGLWVPEIKSRALIYILGSGHALKNYWHPDSTEDFQVQIYRGRRKDWTFFNTLQPHPKIFVQTAAVSIVARESFGKRLWLYLKIWVLWITSLLPSHQNSKKGLITSQLPWLFDWLYFNWETVPPEHYLLQFKPFISNSAIRACFFLGRNVDMSKQVGKNFGAYSVLKAITILSF